jgi:restriction system protein
VIDIVFHYPPDLLNLIVETIPRLCPRKNDVFVFFKGAGVSSSLTQDVAAQLRRDPKSINKFEITRTVLVRLNERGESSLRERREVLKRITEFEDYSACWPDDQLKAKGLVAEIRRIVNVKDSFTRMSQEREQEEQKRRAEQDARAQAEQTKRAAMGQVRSDLGKLFVESNSQRRGKALESVLNRLFEAGGILVREAFVLCGTEGEGIVEQIDGVIELASHIYLVEMKWWKNPIGAGDVAQHQVRVYGRSGARGLYIAVNGFTEPAVTNCRNTMQQSMMILCGLREIILLLEQEKDLQTFLKAKVNAAIIDRNPLFEPVITDL